MTPDEIFEVMKAGGRALIQINAKDGGMGEARAAVAALVAERDRARERIGELSLALSAMETVRETLKRECEALKAERDAAFRMSKCECASDEACANLVKWERQCEALKAERDALRDALTDAKEWVYQYMDQNDCDIDDDELDVSVCMRKIDAALSGAGHE